MKTSEIAALPVKEIALPDSHLYMWVTNNFLARGAHVQVAEGWGFRPVTIISWLKEGRPGLGQYYRGTTEHVVFCVRGAPPYRLRVDGKRAQGLTGFETQDGLSKTAYTDLASAMIAEAEGSYFSERRPGEHSKKPTKIHEWSELVSPGPYLEMFARTARPGWDAWGNEAPEALSLEDVING